MERQYIDLERELKIISKAYKDLISPEEIKELARVYEQIKHTGKKEHKQIREIVPIEEWIESEYYLGREVHNIFPYWKQKTLEVYSSPDRINQVIITGSIGVGKTTFAALLLLRRIYELSCYENVAAMFKLMGVSKIAFAYLSVTKDQAEHSGFAALKEWVDDIPYFQEHFPRHRRLDSFLVFPQENIFVLFGSVANHFIGMNVICSVLDEANFFEGRQVDEANRKMNLKVSSLYSQMVNRSQSRFVINGINYSLNVLVSSTTVESSFTEQMIETSKDDPHTMVISPALWEVKPWNYPSNEWFLVFAGGEGFDPFIIDSIDDINQLLASKGMPALNDTDLFEAVKKVPFDFQSKIIKVPMEHRQAFQGNITIALQDLAGYSVSASSRFFQSNEAYHKAIKDTLQHPFSHGEVTLSTTPSSFQDGFLPLKDYFKPGFKFRNLQAPRYMHIDLAATGDSAGISMGHIASYTNIYADSKEYDEALEDLDNYYVGTSYQMPVVEIDFMLRINPPNKPHRIAFSKIRDFIIYLRNEMGLKIELITADQYQSEMLLQELGEVGFNTGTLSVDRTPDAYNTLANLFYDNRINIYHYQWFYTELFNLIQYPALKKIDHPPIGSKDVSDAVAGVAHNIIKAADKTDIRGSELSQLYLNANQAEITSEDLEEKAKEIGLHLLGMAGLKKGLKN